MIRPLLKVVGQLFEMPGKTIFSLRSGALWRFFASWVVVFGLAGGPLRSQASPDVILLPPSGDARVEPGAPSAPTSSEPAVAPEAISLPEADPQLAPSAPPGAPLDLASCSSPILSAEKALSTKTLLIPVLGVVRSQLRDSYVQHRSGGRTHHAIDIMAPRNTPILAIEDGTIVKLTYNRLGGITLYQLDPTGTYAYYYAHLERYAPGLAAGQPVQRGQVIGYVGTSGNAPKSAPHLHFAIYRLPEVRSGWLGQPINPFEILHPSDCVPEGKLAQEGGLSAAQRAAATALSLVAHP
ncbi:MAG TPA: peptidoglycan DD-metalloendopeptidase family protein [Thermoanaerobaculia bacterium]|jgi:murein DD-endopeptidase MepM/ murein hydrolase activator NlpD|nr:peptidoglycan DD-metalloendopeptidase family protein [Thermoanaerobaculia bacterium]